MKQQVISDLNKLSRKDVRDVLYECIEILGTCDVKESQTALEVGRIRIYQIMNDEIQLISALTNFCV